MIFSESLQHCFRTNWSLRGNSRTNWSNLMEYHCILLAKSQDCMRARQIYYYTATIWLIRLKILVKSYSKRKNSRGPISTRQLSSRTILKKIRVWVRTLVVPWLGMYFLIFREIWERHLLFIWSMALKFSKRRLNNTTPH